MKLKYSISYFVILTAIILTFVYAFAMNHQHEIDGYVVLEDSVTEEIIYSNSDDVVSEGYYLREEEGYVIVYMFDNSTIFLETDILVTSLSDTLQWEIEEGKYIETTNELYSFLENYSS